MKEQIQAQGARFWVQAAMIGAIYVVLTLLFFAYFLWPHTISDFRGIVYFALFYTGGSSGPLCRMPDL